MELEVVFTVTLTQTIGNCAVCINFLGQVLKPLQTTLSSPIKRGQDYKPFGDEGIRDDILKVIQHIVGI